MRSHPVFTGVLLGFGITWIYHHYVRPLPGGGATGSLSGKA